MEKNLKKDFSEILEYAHMWNWAPDLFIVEKIYDEVPNSFSVLTPFLYVYLEELVRSMTKNQYGDRLDDENSKKAKRELGINLVKLAIENANDEEQRELLVKVKKYFKGSSIYDSGDNRNSTLHGYMHPRFWTKESFEKLVHEIASLSKYSGF